MLLTISHTLLYNMTITRCLCVEHFARFALELNKPPGVKEKHTLTPWNGDPSHGIISVKSFIKNMDVF